MRMGILRRLEFAPHFLVARTSPCLWRLRKNLGCNVQSFLRRRSNKEKAPEGGNERGIGVGSLSVKAIDIPTGISGAADQTKRLPRNEALGARIGIGNSRTKPFTLRDWLAIDG